MEILCGLLPLGALILWSLSLKGVEVRYMNDLGLVSVLPPTTIIALLILMVSFTLSLRQPHLHVPLLLLHMALLVFMLYGITTLVEEVSRFAVVYRHAGYTEYIMRTGSVDPNLDAYFNWPGFFVMNAFITQVAGVQTIFAYAGWAPVFYNIIYFGPLYMIFASITTNKRLIWLALWFFYLTNWIGQDYFSPQGLNFFFYLVIIAILLKWFRISPKAQSYGQRRHTKSIPLLSWFTSRFFALVKPSDPITTSIQPWQRLVLLACLLFIFGMVVFSHPLTPFFVLASVAALIVFRRCQPFWLPVAMAIMTGAWIVFMTQSFLAGHSSMVLGRLGEVSSNVSSSITSRVLQGNSQHNLIAELRVIMTALLWGLAALGIFRRWRQGHRDITCLLLALAPFPLIVTQNYGGEMFLRVYLFALPFMAFFAAALFYSKRLSPSRKTSPWWTIAIITANVMLLSGFLFTRYGNENMDYMTHAEINGVDYLYHVAPHGSLLIAGWDNTPWQSKDYEHYTCESLTTVLPNAVIDTDVGKLVQFLDSQKYPHAYLIFARSQKVQAYSLAGVPNGAMDRLEGKMLRSGAFKLIYTNPDVQIFLFVGKTQGNVS